MRKILNTKYNYQNKERIILRDYLALERTRLANERTLLSYIRAAVYLLVGGLTLVQLKEIGTIHWVGYLAIGLSFVFLIVGIVRYYQLKIRLEKNYFAKANEIEGNDNKTNA